MKKVKNLKKLFGTFKWTLGESGTIFFVWANSKSKIFASVDGVYASKDKMVNIWPTKKKIIFYFSLQVPYLQRLSDIKIIKIKEMKNLTLGHL